MTIFINQEKVNDINAINRDPAISEAAKIWGNEAVIKKSSIELSIFFTPFGSISLLYGPRQIGKTASLKLFLSQVTDSETLIFTDCSTILHKADLKEHLGQLIQGKTTIVLDEVQSVPEWHHALRSLYSEGRLTSCRVWCTGSEARHLLESGERLPGRKGGGKTVFARPWSFREYLLMFYPELAEPFRSVNLHHVNQRWLDEQKIDWQKPWHEYELTGGIPRVIGEFRRSGQIPEEIWRVYTDWILGTWSQLRTPERSLAALARRLCETLNSRISYETLRKGTDILSPNTVKTLLDMQEDHFAIRVLPKFDPQRGRFLPAKQRKIYPLDPFIARVWSAIGWEIRRLYPEKIPSLPLDECSFATQTLRHSGTGQVSYLYSETSQAEVDFYFEECGFELKSNGHPTPKQQVLLRSCPQSFVVQKQHLPLIAFLIGEERTLKSSSGS